MTAPIKSGDHVRVKQLMDDGTAHPFAGITGQAINVHPFILGNASIRIDEGFLEAGRIAIISMRYLEKLP